AAGATDKSVQIMAPTFGAEYSPIAQVLQQQLNAIGLKASVLPVSVGDYLKKIGFSPQGPADFDLYVSSFFGYTDPSMILTWWDPKLAFFTKAFFLPDNALSTDILRASILPNGPNRTAAIVSACKQVASDGVMIPLVTRNATV